MKIKENIIKELHILWEERDKAKNNNDYRIAQEKIDEYFLENPKKNKNKKKRKKQDKKIHIHDDD